ncbi:MAG: PIN domain-containing protein [bacterium]
MKSRIYLDTSIPSAYYDTRVPIRQLITQKWFTYEVSNYELYVSQIVLAEINRTDDSVIRDNLIELVLGNNTQVLDTNDEAENLAELYTGKKIIPKKVFNDALHIAVATVNNIQLIASWNFEDMVKPAAVLKINEINVKNGYNLIEIYSLEAFGGAQYGNIS